MLGVVGQSVWNQHSAWIVRTISKVPAKTVRTPIQVAGYLRGIPASFASSLLHLHTSAPGQHSPRLTASPPPTHHLLSSLPLQDGCFGSSRDLYINPNMKVPTKPGGGRIPENDPSSFILGGAGGEGGARGGSIDDTSLAHHLEVAAVAGKSSGRRKRGLSLQNIVGGGRPRPALGSEVGPPSRSQSDLRTCSPVCLLFVPCPRDTS